jgi:NAD(P)-dependent dehydrogenase (short-subunit alcohol dehydrogenase family)
MEMDYYQNKVCVITGASTGIGYGLGVKLLEYGAGRVYFTARTQSKLDEDREKLAAYGERAQFLAVDVTDAQAVSALMNQVVADNGRIDFLFNNAGIGAGGPTERASLHAWERVLNTDLWGVIYGVNAVLPIMLAQGFGHIVNTASIQGLTPAPYQVLYSTAKHAVVGLSESLRMEMLPRNIHVSVLCPGAVESEIFHKGGNDTPKDAITAEHAAVWALERIARHQGIIPVAEAAQKLYDVYRTEPERVEQTLMDFGASIRGRKRD